MSNVAFSSSALFRDKIRKIILEGISCSIWVGAGELPFTGKPLSLEENLVILEGEEDLNIEGLDPEPTITYIDTCSIVAIRYNKADIPEVAGDVDSSSSVTSIQKPAAGKDKENTVPGFVMSRNQIFPSSSPIKQETLGSERQMNKLRPTKS